MACSAQLHGNQCMTLVIKWLIYSLAIFLVSKIIPGIHIDSAQTALFAGAALGLLNVLVRPVLRVLTFPINLITLGLFGLVLNVLLFWSAAYFVEGYEISGFFAAALGALVVSIITTFGNFLVFGSDGKWDNKRKEPYE